MKTKKEEVEMKTENMEGTESNERNMTANNSSGAISRASTQKRTTASVKQYPQGWLMTENRH
jgi:hypothetical protein